MRGKEMVDQIGALLEQIKETQHAAIAGGVSWTVRRALLECAAAAIAAKRAAIVAASTERRAS